MECWELVWDGDVGDGSWVDHDGDAILSNSLKLIDDDSGDA